MQEMNKHIFFFQSGQVRINPTKINFNRRDKKNQNLANINGKIHLLIGWYYILIGTYLVKCCLIFPYF